MVTENISNIPNPKDQIIPSGSNLFKIAFLILMMVLSFYLTQRGVERLEQMGVSPVYKWALIGLAAIWNGVLMLGMGALAHDAVHKVLFRSLFWNEFWGGLLSALTLIPFHANRQFHLSHHSYAHQPGLDPENQMHHHSFIVAAAAGPFIGLYAQYRLFMLNILRCNDVRYAIRALKDALSISSAGLIYFLLLPAAGIEIKNTVLPMILLFPAVFTWRALSDHYGIPPVVRETKKSEVISDIDEEILHQETSGWVVITHPLLEWLWSHVNYHEVHHKYPYLSHQYLPQVFNETRDKHPYLVVDGYWKSLLNLRKKNYYAAYEDIKNFMSVQHR